MNAGLKRTFSEEASTAKDHASSESPSKLRKTITKLTEENAQIKKKLQATRMKNVRLKIKVKSLESVVQELKSRNLVSDECAEILENTYAEVPKEIMKRIILQKKNKSPGAYPPELTSFALTLIEGDPGFTLCTATFLALAAKVSASRQSGERVICSLMLGEMAIKKLFEWNGYWNCSEE